MASGILLKLSILQIRGTDIEKFQCTPNKQLIPPKKTSLVFVHMLSRDTAMLPGVQFQLRVIEVTGDIYRVEDVPTPQWNSPQGQYEELRYQKKTNNLQIKNICFYSNPS